MQSEAGRLGASRMAPEALASAASAWAREHAEGLALAGVLLVAALARGSHAIRSAFPANDGGLFYAMAEDIRASGFLLPATTSYNGGAIPFAYPPLGPYLAALLDALTPLSLLAVFWLLPLVLTVAAVAALYRLARVLFEDRVAALCAALAFALIPRSFVWLLMGGGVARALGLVLALLALAEFARALRTEDARRPLATAAGLCALTAMAHLETAAFLGASLAVFAVARPRVRSLWLLAAVGAGATLLAAPWWGTVVARDGFAPFLAALEQGGPLLAEGSVPAGVRETLLDPVFTSEPHFPLLGALGVLGGLLALVRGQWLLPVWWALIIVLHMRAFATFTAVPTALLAGLALAMLVAAARDHIALRPRFERQRATLVAGTVGLGALAFAFAGVTAREGSETWFLGALAPAEVEAMRWAERTTSDEARFAVISGAQWYHDRDAEWFPAIAGREAVNTPQGLEWIDGAFEATSGLHHRFRNCAESTVHCLEPLRRESAFTHLFVPLHCCEGLRKSIEASERYRVVYSGAALIAERVDPSVTAAD